MARLGRIVKFLDELLNTSAIKDDSWNGLQFEGKEEVKKIIFGVTAGMELFQKAEDKNANMIIVHHGHFWKGLNPSINSFSKQRLNFLFTNQISLYANHLPLDMHAEYGNNAQLIKILGFEKDKEFAIYRDQNISFTAKTDRPKDLNSIREVLEKEIGAICKTLFFGKKEISTLAVCSGGAGWGPFMEAMNLGVDLYITGDSTEMYHMAKDAKMNVIFAGHHATETVGVKALMPVLEKEFSIKTEFIDVPTGL